MSSNPKKTYTVPAERQDMILQYIKARGSGQIKELAEFVGASEATVRRDLDELDHMGKVERTHGGAVSNRFGTSFERQHEDKLNLMQEEKLRIAQAAASYIKEGDTVFIDSGTTTYFMKNCLSDIPNLTVFTYDLIIAYALELHPTSNLFVTGGQRRPGYNNVLLGSQVIEFLRNLRIDKAFMGADALDPDYGISNSNFLEAEIKRQATRISETIFLLADHSKFDTVALAKVCDIEDIDVLITDSGISEHYLNKFDTKIDRIEVV